MPAQPRPITVLQVRAIGTAVTVLGPNITTRTHTRSAGRIGYVRAYLTITRKETTTDDQDG